MSMARAEGFPITGENLIGWSDSGDGDRSLVAVSPVTEAYLPPTFVEATPGAVNRAMALAGEASGILRGFSGKRLGGLCDSAAASLEASRDVILERCGLETGYSADRLKGEYSRMLSQMRMFAAVARDGLWLNARIDHADPNRTPNPKPDVRSMHVPVGPVVVFGASNFPLALSTGGSDTASALAAGCAVVVKGHPSHPGTSELIGRAIRDAARYEQFPEGTFSLIQGASPEAGRRLVGHPLTAAVGFTGSIRVGRELFDLAAARPTPIPVYAEMGSVNPQFVLPGKLAADPSGFAERLFASVTLGNGQFCTNPGLVFVEEGDASRAFVKRYRELLDAWESQPMLNARLCLEYQGGVERFAAAKGVNVYSARTVQSQHRPAAVLVTATLQDFQRDPALLQGEVFGPLTVVVLYPYGTDPACIAPVLQGQLSASIHGSDRDLTEARGLLLALTARVGRLVVNGFPTGVDVCHALHHGGPFPSSTDAHFTSIGSAAIARWYRPICFQDVPDELLPDALRERNPLGIVRLVDGHIGSS